MSHPARYLRSKSSWWLPVINYSSKKLHNVLKGSRYTPAVKVKWLKKYPEGTPLRTWKSLELATYCFSMKDSAQSCHSDETRFISIHRTKIKSLSPFLFCLFFTIKALNEYTSLTKYFMAWKWKGTLPVTWNEIAWRY